MSDKDCDPSSKSNFSFHVGAVALNILSVYDLLCCPTYNTCYDLIKQHTYHIHRSRFYLKDWVIVYEDQIIYYFQNS